MTTVSISPEFKIEIPEDARKIMGIKPGEKLELLAEPGRMVLIRVRDLAEMEGIYRGMDTSISKEKEKY